MQQCVKDQQTLPAGSCVTDPLCVQALSAGRGARPGSDLPAGGGGGPVYGSGAAGQLHIQRSPSGRSRHLTGRLSAYLEPG